MKGKHVICKSFAFWCRALTFFLATFYVGSNMQESRERANDMLQMLKKAKELSNKKCYDVEEVRNQAKSTKRYLLDLLTQLLYIV